MPDLDSQLTRWQSAGVLDAETASRIRALESEGATEPSAHAAVAPSIATPAGLKWLVVTGLILGAILLACGVVLFVSAHWDQLGPAGRYLLVIAMVAVFHIAGGLTRSNFEGLSSALHAVGTISTGAAIALVGQIFNIQEHWPAAVLLWALAALAGWLLLRDQAQQTLALLLVPAWIFSELGFRIEGHIGSDVYMGRLCFLWAILYLTFFAGSRRKVVKEILFAASAISRGYWHLFHARRLGRMVLGAIVHPLRHVRVGLGRDRRDTARRRRIPRPQRAGSHRRRDRVRDRAAVVLLHLDRNRDPGPTEALTSGQALAPISPPTHWWPPSPSFSAGGACARSRARWSISAF